MTVTETAEYLPTWHLRHMQTFSLYTQPPTSHTPHTHYIARHTSQPPQSIPYLLISHWRQPNGQHLFIMICKLSVALSLIIKGSSIILILIEKGFRNAKTLSSHCTQATCTDWNLLTGCVGVWRRTYFPKGQLLGTDYIVIPRIALQIHVHKIHRSVTWKH